MRISTIGYVIKQGVKNIGRNMMFSLASIATMSACIFLFGLFFSILFNFQYIIKSAEEGVAITVFFEDGITQAQIDNIGQALRGRDDVSDVKYVSADDAWEEFRSKYFGENEELADVFSDGADEVLNMLRKMSGTDLSEEETAGKTPRTDVRSGQAAKTRKAPAPQIACQLFAFASLNDVTRLAHVAPVSYQGANSLYKNEKNGSYLLLVDSAGQDASSFNRICNLITEYGRPEKSVLSAKAYLEEHFEPLIRENALASLAQI